MLLREIRVLQRMTQQELAKMTGCCQKTISNYENFFAIPDEARKHKLADILGCGPDVIEWDRK